MSTFRDSSFSRGELTPSLWARCDLAAYATGLATCRNHLVKKQGGLANRPGTQFICEVKDSSKTVRLIAWIFNNEQAYTLEFGNLYMRVIKNGAQVTVSPIAWSNSTTYAVGDIVSYVGVSYICILGGLHDIPPPTPAVWSVLSGNIFEIPTPYLEADLMALNFDQTADVLTIVHPNYPPMELARTGDTAWTLTAIAFGTSIAAPGGVAIVGSPGGFTWTYLVTAVSAATGEESLAGTGTGPGLSAPSALEPHTITWGVVSGAASYRVYREKNAVNGFIGVGFGTSFIDDGIEPDVFNNPPTNPGLFVGTGNYPSAVVYSQQRLWFANSLNDPERMWGSRVGAFKNFNVEIPITDDSPLAFRLVGGNVNAIKHLIELRQLLAMTSGAEWAINGDGAGGITPTAINAKRQSYNGSGLVRPLNVDGSIVFLESRSSSIRDLGFSFESDGYDGQELSIFSDHLFNGKTIVDWSYQKIPNSIVWAVRDDGTLLGMTYVKKQELLAWHRHDTDGSFENVCVVPEGTEDAVYVVVKRTIQGVTKRYIERLHTRLITDIRNAVFLDSSLSYDGRNTDSTKTMTLSGGSTWNNLESLTLMTNFSPFFTAGDVGNAIHLTGSDGSLIRFSILAYVSPTEVTGKPNKIVPVSMRTTPLSTWAKAVDTVSGLEHLEGKTVGVFADGFVVHSPNNPKYATKIVTDGAITLSHPYAVIHCGLPITADVETLDVDITGRGTLMPKNKLVTAVQLYVENSRGGFIGASPPDGSGTAGLSEVMERETEDYDDPPELITGSLDPTNIRPEWNSTGRVFLRVVDPVSFSLLAVVPLGSFGGGN